MADYIFLLETRLGQEQQAVLRILQQIARPARLNLYLTGGPMRDLLTGKPVRYLDFTTEGDPAAMAAGLAAAGAERISPHPEQRSLNLSLRGCRLRIMAARPAGGGAIAGAVPGTIVDDLRRRGLTLNSIGLSLNQGSRGLLLDPTNGIADIEARLIRMNHAYVFLEEPIVLLRAVRLQTRLGFAIEERTLARMESAREGHYVARATPAALGQELEAIAYEPDPAVVIQALDEQGWLEAAYGKGLRPAKIQTGSLARLDAAIARWEQLGLVVDAGLAALPFLLGGLAPADQTHLSKLLVSHDLATEWKKIPGEAAALEKRLLAKPQGLEQLYDLVAKTVPEAVVYSSLETGDAKAAKKLNEFHARALELRQRLPLALLQNLGIAPQSEEAERYLQPLYRQLLNGATPSDAELAEALRAAVHVEHPAAPPPAPPPVRGAKAKPGKAAPGREAREAASAPSPAPPPLPAPATARRPPPAPPAKLAKPAAKSSPKPTLKPASKPIPKAAAKAKPAPGKKKK